MSQTTVLNNFLTVGNSRSKEPAYADENYAPIARFGVGFWSVFTIAERAHIETSPFERAGGSSEGSNQVCGFAFDVALDELKDYTVFQTKDVPTGTSVTLYLKSGVVLDDVFDSARNQLLASAVELRMVLDGEETVVSEGVPDVTGAMLLGARQRSMEAQGVKVFQWRGDSNGVDLAMALAYRAQEDGLPTFRANERQSLLSSLGGIHFIRTAVCGFIAPVRPSANCFEPERIGHVHANHRSPRGFEFSLDRRSLIENDAQRSFSHGIADLIHVGYREFLKSTNAYYPREIFRLNEESKLSGGNVFDQYTGGELAEAQAGWPDLLCFRLFLVDAANPFSEVKPIYANLQQLQKMSGQCWVLQNHIDIPLGNGLSHSIYEDGLHSVAYELVRTTLRGVSSTEPNFVLDANRPASMLFDADANSTVTFFDVTLPGVGSNISVCIQRLNLANIQFDKERHDMLVEVQGKWPGAVYIRNFEHPNRKPYVFLGRYRVLVRRSSRLHDHISKLKDTGRSNKIASLISDLQEDDAGYMPASLSGLI